MNDVISQTAFINIQFKIYHSQHYIIARCHKIYHSQHYIIVMKTTHITCIRLYNFLQLNLTRIFGFGFMVFNATFNNISVTLWRSVILVGETGLPREIHRPIASHWQILSHKSIIKYISPWAGFELTTLTTIWSRPWRFLISILIIRNQQITFIECLSTNRD